MSTKAVFVLLLVLCGTVVAQTRQSTGFINVREYGCYGDDRHDDSSCFERVEAAVESAIRPNPSLSSDGNRLGSVSIFLPSGNYLVTRAILIGRSAPRTAGYKIFGQASGQSVIDYQPVSHEPLFTNNDAWLKLEFQYITFIGNSDDSVFLRSISKGGAQAYEVHECVFAGVWSAIFVLSGTNGNSEWNFESDTFVGTVKYVLMIPQTDTSDQFLNFWFSHCNFDLAKGGMIEAWKGGHFEIDECDFSGLRGSGNTRAPSVIFRLLGRAHAQGVTFFNCKNSRFELQSESVKVLESEWGSDGQITFEDDDFSSQSLFLDGGEQFTLDLSARSGSAQYNFVRCHLMGAVNIVYSDEHLADSDRVTFEDTVFLSFNDYSEAIVFHRSSQTKSIPTTYPIVECIRCRGRTASGPLDVSKVATNAEWVRRSLTPSSRFADDATLRPIPKIIGSALLKAVCINGSASEDNFVVLPPYSLIVSVMSIEGDAYITIGSDAKPTNFKAPIITGLTETSRTLRLRTKSRSASALITFY